MATAPQGPPLGQPGFHLHDDQGPCINATMIALIALSVTFLCARLLSRRLARVGYWVKIPNSSRVFGATAGANGLRRQWDDALVTIACVCDAFAIKIRSFNLTWMELFAIAPACCNILGTSCLWSPVS